MARLFVAVDLPHERAASLQELQDSDLNARWTPADQFHVTVRFLGEVDDQRAKQFESRLEDIDLPSFQLGGQGLDVFPSTRKPRVLVAHVNEEPGLMALQESVDDLAVEMGFDEDDRPFNPHITIARLKVTSPQEIRAFLKRHTGFGIDPFVAAGFRLYESSTGSEGAVHTLVREYELRHASAGM